jgi:DNA-binding CsgD family transcriptional regulator/tetratricopeptide (TPR) repeat protein
VTRLLEQRIKRLPGAGVHVLATAAVLGRRFDQMTLLKVGDMSQRAVLKALHDAVDAHLVRDAGDGRTLEFQHALVREAAENLLLSSERKELHQRIAEELESRDTPPAESAAIAYHYGKAGLLAQHGHHAVAAADAAWRAGAPIEAARWYEQALTAGAERGEVEPETVLLRAAEAFAAARLPKLATDTFERLIERQRARGDVLAEGETLAEFATLFYGDFERVNEMLRHALQILEPLGETATLARVYGRLASLYVVKSLAREAIDAGRMARDIAKRTGATDAESVGRRALGTIVAAGGDLAAGYRFLERSIELAKSVHKHMDVYISSLSLVDAAIRANDWKVAETTARESIDYSRKLGSGSEAGSLMARLADLLRFTGRVEEARLTIDKALLLLDQDEAYLFNNALLVKAEVLADLGRWQDVRELIEPMLPAAELSAQFHIYGGALFLLARAASGEGRRPEAVQLVDGALAEWRLSQDNYYCLPMLLFACRLACEAADLAAARSFIVELQGVSARTALCSATIPAAEAWLAVAEGRLDDAIRLWRESTASFEALGRPVEACRVRLELGRTLVARGADGDRGEARVHLVAVQSSFAGVGLPEAGQAEALLRRHRLIPPSARGDGPLSAREREIVALIADGLTNRRIAAELTLSARTVDNHVSRILNKLQLASRSQIVAFAIEHEAARRTHDK